MTTLPDDERHGSAYTMQTVADNLAESVSCISCEPAILRCEFCLAPFIRITTDKTTAYAARLFGTSEAVIIPFDTSVALIESEQISSTIRNIEALLPQKYPAYKTCCDKRVKNRLYEIAAIVGRRYRGRRCEYRVRWSAYSLADDTWEPKENVAHCTDLLAAFNSTV